MSLNACIVGCKVITLIGSEATDMVYEGDLWTLMMIYKADTGLGCKWNGIISTIQCFMLTDRRNLCTCIANSLHSERWGEKTNWRNLFENNTYIFFFPIVNQNPVQDSTIKIFFCLPTAWIFQICTWTANIFTYPTIKNMYFVIIIFC